MSTGHEGVQWAIDAASENPHGSVIVDSQRLASLAAVVDARTRALQEIAAMDPADSGLRAGDMARWVLEQT